MKNQCVCFTGHRVILKDEKDSLIKKLNYAIEHLVVNGVKTFLCGGALGFDMLAGNVVLDVKKKNPEIHLIMVLPCKDQAASWNPKNQAEHRAMVAACDEVICLSPAYYYGCMRARNLYLVEHSNICVAYLKRMHSGTSQTVRMASERGHQVLNLRSNCSLLWPM